jgi:hypothetical protein
MPNCPLTLRTVKGSKLTFNELDGNFLSLQNCINIVENNLNNLVNNTLNNRWHVPYGTTVTVNDGFQSFVYGDLYVEGLIELLGDSQLVVLNGDIILSGGTISGTGVSYVIDIPEYDSYVTGGTYNNSTQAIDFSGNLGFPSFSVDVSTLSNDITVVSGVYDNTTGTATFTNNTGGTFTVTGFLTGYTNYYTTGATLNCNIIEFDRTDLTNAYSVDLTPVLSAFSTTNYYTTGATLNGTILEFDRTDLTNAYSVDLSPLKFTGNTISECIPDIYVSNIHSCSPLNINPNDEGNIIFGSTSGVTVDLNNNILISDNLRVTSGATNGYVLTSDALGNATWGLPPNIYNSDGTLSSGRIIDLNGNGIACQDTTGNGEFRITIDDGVSKIGESILRGDEFRVFVGDNQTSSGGIYVDNNKVELVIYSSDTSTVITKMDVTPLGVGISGKTKTTTLQITSGATNGYVLTSDSLGNASWQVPTGGGVSINPYFNVGSTSIITWNVSGQSTNYKVTLTGTTTLNLTNVRDGEYGTIIVRQDTVGSRTITLGTVNGTSVTHLVSNGAGGIPVLTSNPNAVDVLTFTYDNSFMYWTVGNDYT